MEELAVKAALAIDVIGPATVLMTLDQSGRPRLTGCLPRFPASVSLTVAAGVNTPQMAVDHALGLPVSAASHQELGMVRTFREHFLSVDELKKMQESAA
jgi:hypothetical protein